jgi:hypothetical protein
MFGRTEHAEPFDNTVLEALFSYSAKLYFGGTYVYDIVSQRGPCLEDMCRFGGVWVYFVHITWLLVKRSLLMHDLPAGITYPSMFGCHS